MTSAADPHKGWLRRLIGYCWRYPKLVTFALLGSLVYTIVAVLIPLIQRDIVNNAILTHRQPIWPGATALIIAALVGFGGVYTRRYLGGRMSLDVQHDLRTEMFAVAVPARRRPPGRAADRPARQPVDLRRQHDPGPAGVPADPARQRRCCSSLSLVVDGVAVAAAHARRARGRAGAVRDLAGARGSELFPASWDAQQQAGDVARRRSRKRSPACASSRASARRSGSSSGSRARAAACYAARVRAVRLTSHGTTRRCRPSRRSARSACSRSAAGWPSAATSRSARSSRSPPTSPSWSARSARSPA